MTAPQRPTKEPKPDDGYADVESDNAYIDTLPSKSKKTKSPIDPKDVKGKSSKVDSQASAATARVVGCLSENTILISWRDRSRR